MMMNNNNNNDGNKYSIHPVLMEGRIVFVVSNSAHTILVLVQVLVIPVLIWMEQQHQKCNDALLVFDKYIK